MKKLIALAAITLFLGAGCSSNPTPTNPVTPPVVVPTQPTQPVVPAQPTTTTQVLEDATKPPVLEDATKSIRVTNIWPGTLFYNGDVVRGTAVAFESQFSWKLADATGRVVSQGTAHPRQPDAGVPGPFEIPVFFDKVPLTATGTLILFEASAKDGTPIHVVKVSVAFSSKTMTVNVYFGNTKKNPNAMDCSLVYPVERVVPEGAPDAIAVYALLKGPTEKEKAAGYYSSIPDGVTLQNAADEEGDSYLDFNQALQKDIGGSCRVTSIRSQITATALQGSKQHVTISIDGVTDGILQP